MRDAVPSAALVQPGQRLSWEEYAALPEDPRVECVDGLLLVGPSPTRAHQEICHRLVTLLKAVLPEGWAVTAAWAWKPGAGEYIPDVMVHPATDEQVRSTGTPALCVEVLSSNRGDDLVLEPMRYARAGLPRYWVIDPRDGELSAHHLMGSGVYERVSHLAVDEAPGAQSGAQIGRLSAGPTEVTIDLAGLLAL